MHLELSTCSLLWVECVMCVLWGGGVTSCNPTLGYSILLACGTSTLLTVTRLQGSVPSFSIFIPTNPWMFTLNPHSEMATTGGSYPKQTPHRYVISFCIGIPHRGGPSMNCPLECPTLGTRLNFRMWHQLLSYSTYVCCYLA